MPIVEMKTEHMNPGQSTAKALQKELRQRAVGSVSSVCTSPSGQSPGLKPHVIQQIQLATERSSLRATSQADDSRKGVNFHNGESSDSSGSKNLLGKRSLLPTPKCTTPEPPLLRGAGKAGGPAGPPKKRRTRASKKPRTTLIEANCEEFRGVVQSLTGGTFCSQTSSTASPILSASSVTKNSPELSAPARVPAAAAEPYVVRPHPTRVTNTNGILGDSSSAGSEVLTAPSIKVSLPVSQEQVEFSSFLFQGSEDAGTMNDMMGYDRQSSWNQWESFESMGVSSSTQFAGVTETSGCGYTMPYLLEESDVSKEVGPYQREVQLASEGLKGADSGNMLPRRLRHADEEIESWFVDHPPHKGLYSN